jgi:hypothetical protein
MSKCKQIDTMITCPVCGHKCGGLFHCKDGVDRCAHCVKSYNKVIKDVEMIGNKIYIRL